MTQLIIVYGLLVFANILYFFVPGLRVVTAGILIFVSGIGWTTSFRQKETSFDLNTFIEVAMLMTGFGVTFTALTVLGLHYLPGPISVWGLLIALNLFAFLPLVWLRSRPSTPFSWLNLPQVILIVIILVAALLRFGNLQFSEFQGDEALVMILAAEAIEGHEDAFFLRGKGPGEILIPLAIWLIKGTITELDARMPSFYAGVGALLTFYLIAKSIFDTRTAVSSTLLLAGSGFMLGFSRIVQYQMLVVWMSALAVWTLWRWHETGLRRWAWISGLFAGIGLLAHYDAIFILPVLGWLFLRQFSFPQSEQAKSAKRILPSIGLWLVGFLVSTLPFYLPYLFDPQISGTQSYLIDRIGDTLLKNNLAAFFEFNSFYSSFYYVLLMSVLLLAAIGLILQQNRWGKLGGWLVAVGGLTVLFLLPNLLGTWTGIPIALILLTALLNPNLSLPLRLALIWFTVPFIGYNFGVARPLTHIYTIVPGWALLAGWALNQVRLNRYGWAAIQVALLCIFSGYQWAALVDRDRDFVADYPHSLPAGYWSPYSRPPETGFFGFPRRTGWKAVGALVADGQLVGDYDSNEEEDITSWYTRHQSRACDPGAEFYYIGTNLLDEVPIPADLLDQEYVVVGQATAPNHHLLFIHQQKPAALNLGQLNEPHLARQFDRTATPAAFARTPRWQVDAPTNFAGKIQLLGYSLDTKRAYPGGRVVVTLYWQLITPVAESYKTFVQLDPERKFAQADSFPVCARYPTNRWRPGQIIADQRALHLSPETPLETLTLGIGLYEPESGQQLDYLDVAGNPAGVILPLTQVEIRAK